MPFLDNFSKQTATFFTYLISLITALTVNEMWKHHFKAERPWYRNLGIAVAMIAVCVALLAVISTWTEDDDCDD